MLMAKLLYKPGLVGLTWSKTVHLNPDEKSTLTLAWEFLCSSAASLTLIFSTMLLHDYHAKSIMPNLCRFYITYGFGLFRFSLLFPVWEAGYLCL